jgi:hypothetical protein
LTNPALSQASILHFYALFEMRSRTLQPCAYTVVVTSCRRFDLLRPSLTTLKQALDVEPQKWIVIEDSDDESVRACVAEAGIRASVIVNGTQIGQMRSIDRAYAEVETPYVFHSEDDWSFYRSGFIRESAALLEADPRISMVGLRSRPDQNPLVRHMPSLSHEGIGYFMLDPRLHPEYFGYCFNPGLRRLSDYRAIGPFAAIGHEADVSYAFKQRGFAIANLEAHAVRHLGEGRHVHDPTMPPKARTLSQRLTRSIQKRWKRLKRALPGT